MSFAHGKVGSGILIALSNPMPFGWCGKHRGYTEIRVRAFTGIVKADFSNGIMVESWVSPDGGPLIQITCPEAPANTVNWL